MVNRHIARTVVLQVIFERDANANLSVDESLNRLDDYAEEFGAQKANMPFMRELLQTVISKQSEIDEVITKAAPEWPIDRIAAIDRSILRLGLAELLFSDRTQVPPKVAINESIELAKEFGGASSGKFVNGVLGAVYAELGEPGKEEGGQRKATLDGKAPVLEHMIGTVVYAREGNEVYFAFVHDIFGHWTLVKGKIHEGEAHEDAVRRKVKDETGLDVLTIEENLGENEYLANDTEHSGVKKARHVHYYLVQAPFDDLRLKNEGGLDDVQWFPLANVGDLNVYDDIMPIVTRAIMEIAKKPVIAKE